MMCTISIIITNAKSNKIPQPWMAFSTSRFIGFFRIISIKQKITWAPSSPGIGKKLNIARFAASNGSKYKKFAIPYEAIDVICDIVDTGPPSWFKAIWPVIIAQNYLTIKTEIFNVNGIKSLNTSPKLYEIFFVV